MIRKATGGIDFTVRVRGYKIKCFHISMKFTSVLLVKVGFPYKKMQQKQILLNVYCCLSSQRSVLC